MKRSNIIFLSLIIFLFIMPFATVGIFSFLPHKQQILELDKKFRVIMIDNPSLDEEHIHINQGLRVWPFSKNNSKTLTDGSSYVYYEGDKIYQPAIHYSVDTLFVGKPEAGAKDVSILKIYAEGAENVSLNGNVIWNKE